MKPNLRVEQTLGSDFVGTISLTFRLYDASGKTLLVDVKRKVENSTVMDCLRELLGVKAGELLQETETMVDNSFIMRTNINHEQVPFHFTRWHLEGSERWVGSDKSWADTIGDSLRLAPITQMHREYLYKLCRQCNAMRQHKNPPAVSETLQLELF